MGLIDTLFGRAKASPTAALYEAIVARGRAPHWYLRGGVPDTLDGRFDMITAIMCLVMLRLEALAAPATSARLAEDFIADMDAQLRQSGVGDVGIGKHVGQMMALLGGRLGAYREGLAAGDLTGALTRNLYRGDAPPAACAHVAAALTAFSAGLGEISAQRLLAGDMPA